MNKSGDIAGWPVEYNGFDENMTTAIDIQSMTQRPNEVYNVGDAISVCEGKFTNKVGFVTGFFRKVEENGLSNCCMEVALPDQKIRLRVRPVEIRPYLR